MLQWYIIMSKKEKFAFSSPLKHLHDNMTGEKN